MGNSAQQHRVAIGCYSRATDAKLFLPSSKCGSRRQTETSLLHLAIFIFKRAITVTVIMFLLSCGAESLSMNPITSDISRDISHTESEPQVEPVSAQVKSLLLILSGDVEMNPGPDKDSNVVDSLTSEIQAFLITYIFARVLSNTLT